MSPEEALAALRALCNKANSVAEGRGRVTPKWVLDVRAVLDRVQPTPPAGIHRITDTCSCPIGHDHDIEQMEQTHPGLIARMTTASRDNEPTPPAGIDPQVVVDVLGMHRWKDMGPDWCSCECGAILRGDGSLTEFPADLAFRQHVADRVAARLEAGHG